jgi:hypothetical protein
MIAETRFFAGVTGGLKNPASPLRALHSSMVPVGIIPTIEIHSLSA